MVGVDGCDDEALRCPSSHAHVSHFERWERLIVNVLAAYPIRLFVCTSSSPSCIVRERASASDPQSPTRAPTALARPLPTSLLIAR